MRGTHFDLSARPRHHRDSGQNAHPARWLTLFLECATVVVSEYGLGSFIEPTFGGKSAKKEPDSLFGFQVFSKMWKRA
jgi:hypothetical protein